MHLSASTVLFVLIGGVASAASPWDGTWKLDPGQSTAGAAEMAADGYAFHIDGDRFQWEIPSLG